jgi:hypothetical protein
VFGAHAGDNLHKEYEEIAAQYGNEGKILRMVMHDASNNIKAFVPLVESC